MRTKQMLQKIIGVVAYRGIPFKMASRPQSSAQKENIDETALRIVFPKLVEKLNAEDVIDELFGKDLLNREEYEGILDVCSKENSKSVNRRVLMAIIRRPLGFAAKLAEILRKKDSSLADALEKGEWRCMHACSVVCEVTR